MLTSLGVRGSRNGGANVGRVVLHSGTVGAALTAGVHGVRALAVSLDVVLIRTGPTGHWDTATGLLPDVLALLLDLPEGTVLSLNVQTRVDAGTDAHPTLSALSTVREDHDTGLAQQLRRSCGPAPGH